jgi:carboxypeptidase Taq
MNDKLLKLKEILGEVYDLNTVLAVLDWDQQVNMPSAGTEGRANQAATVSRIAHEKFVDDSVGALLEDLLSESSDLDPDSDEACMIKVVKREYDRQKKVPSSYVAEFAATASAAHMHWEKAKHESEFSLFSAPLKKIFDLRREYAGFFAPYDHVYDPLLDEFEPGMKTADVLAIFDKVRASQVELIHEIAEKAQPDTACLHQHFNPQAQWDFAVDAASAIGYDFTRGRQDRAVHPFTTTFNLDDVRITTHIYPDNLSGLFSTLHEAGHAIYEQNVSKLLARTPLGTGASLAIHESQSRMWENLIGRSKAFWKFMYPGLQKSFPGVFDDTGMEQFYRAINKVEPGFIRVDADEATYNLHIMLRLELEIAVLERRIEVSDLPEAWNTKMHEYLGIIPPNDSLGVLQDVHWASGAVGYFPTYALGNMISAQVWEAAAKDMPELESSIERGNFGDLREWLAEKIHRHGAKFEPQELVRRVTGSEIDPEPYLKYLRGKYTELYSL